MGTYAATSLPEPIATATRPTTAISGEDGGAGAAAAQLGDAAERGEGDDAERDDGQQHRLVGGAEVVLAEVDHPGRAAGR